MRFHLLIAFGIQNYAFLHSVGFPVTCVDFEPNASRAFIDVVAVVYFELKLIELFVIDLSIDLHSEFAGWLGKGGSLRLIPSKPGAFVVLGRENGKNCLHLGMSICLIF